MKKTITVSELLKKAEDALVKHIMLQKVCVDLRGSTYRLQEVSL